MGYSTKPVLTHGHLRSMEEKSTGFTLQKCQSVLLYRFLQSNSRVGIIGLSHTFIAITFSVQGYKQSGAFHFIWQLLLNEEHWRNLHKEHAV